jgi:hypothetical protein
MFHDFIRCGGRSNLYGLRLSQSSNLRVADDPLTVFVYTLITL